MHIVLPNQWYPPESGWGGVAMWNYALARALMALGHRVTIITARHSDQIPAFEIRDGITLHRLLLRDRPRWRRIPLLGRYVREWLQLAYARRVDKQLRVLHRAQPFDVVEFADVNAEGFFYARRPETAVVVRCHTPTFVLKQYYLPSEMQYDTRLSVACEKDLIRRAHALTAPSQDMARVIAETANVPRENISVIPNALPQEFLTADRRHQTTDDESQIANRKSEIKNQKSAITILHVGRLERVKGVEVLAQAIPQVLKKNPTAQFVFIGDDLRTARRTSQRAELETFLENAGARTQVIFLSGVDHATLVEWYRRADICVVPTLNYESFSYTCAQALAFGKPVVASRLGGIPETVQDGVSGLLVPPEDVESLSNALVHLAGDAELRAQMGAAGRRAAQSYDARTIAARVLQVYQSAKEVYSTQRKR